jgi:hypothetical protein
MPDRRMAHLLEIVMDIAGDERMNCSKTVHTARKSDTLHAATQ